MYCSVAVALFEKRVGVEYWYDDAPEFGIAEAAPHCESGGLKGVDVD